MTPGTLEAAGKHPPVLKVRNRMNKRIIITTFLLSLFALTVQAQNSKDSLYIVGSVADAFTKAAVKDAFVTLMRTDSMVVDTTRVYDSHTWISGVGRGNATSRYYFQISREPQDYIIKVEHPNYETAFAPYTQKRVSRRLQDVNIPTIYLKKAARASHFEGGELGEVVVKATRVKMVWKGDTLVYNADAFNVPEGSMLDGLIRQLPGVELTDEGEIFVNGKKIDNLTLNGADFFKGKNKVMLDNLPYFTVKNIQVYNKQTEENKFLGITDEDKKEYTMDVVLKREYSIGGSANLEAGASPGPSEGGEWRYKLKGFGLRFSDRTRAVLFGGLNNINETIEYNGDRSNYSERSNQSGDRHFRQVGGQFVYQAPENRLTNSTEVEASWQDDQTETRQQSETYMSDASTFGLSQGTSRSKPTNLNMRNTLRAAWEEKWRLYSDLQLSYDRRRTESEGWNLTTADAVMTDSVNSSWYRSRSKNDRFGGRGYAYLTRKLATGDAISLSVQGNFSRQYNPDSWSLNHYDYHKTGTTDHRDRYTHSPGHDYSYSADLSYRYQLTENIDITPRVGIATSDNRANRHEYLRDSVDYLFDQQNSYEQRTRTLDRRASLDFSFNKQFKGYSMYAGPSFSINFQRQRMRYDSQPLSTDLTRHYTLFQPNVYFYIMNNKQELWGQYYLYPSTPSVTDLIDRPITSDPLNIYLGNPDLKMQVQHNWSLNYNVRRDSIDQTIRVSIGGSIIHNQRTQGYTYDLTTGIRTYRPENIGSGNWNLSTTANWTRALGRQKLFHITNEVTLRYNKSTGLALTTGSTSSELSRVGNFFVRYKPNIRYQKQNLTLWLRGEVNYRNIHRNITVGQQPTDIWDFSYGINGSYKLPWQFTIDTDLTMNSHRGYADAEMNDNRLYWDASLTKSFHQGRWVLKLRGYDLLGQVSSLRYSINAQGRTETWTNSMRRYAMLTASYRFSQKPKKK